MADFDKNKLIEDFHLNKLTTDSKAQFDELFKKDPDFQQEVDNHSSVIKGLDSLHLDFFQNRLMQMESKHQENIVPIKTNTRPINRLYIAAAAIALLITATVAFNFMQQDVFQQHFQASASIALHIESMRSDNEMPPKEQIKKEAFAAYKTGNFKEAISLLNNYNKNFSDFATKDHQSILVLGVALLATGESQKAISNFDIIIKSNNFAYKQEAEWMWVMAMFQQGKGKETKAMLQEIIEQDRHTYKEKAQDVLLKL